MENEEEVHSPSETELAACALVVELIRSGRIITFIGDILVERVDELDHPNEPEEAVVIRRFVSRSVPGLREESTEAIWKAAEMIESIRETLLNDFEMEMELEQRRN